MKSKLRLQMKVIKSYGDPLWMMVILTMEATGAKNDTLIICRIMLIKGLYHCYFKVFLLGYLMMCGQLAAYKWEQLELEVVPLGYVAVCSNSAQNTVKLYEYVVWKYIKDMF